jgi:hypothetical protein
MKIVHVLAYMHIFRCIDVEIHMTFEMSRSGAILICRFIKKIDFQLPIELQLMQLEDAARVRLLRKKANSLQIMQASAHVARIALLANGLEDATAERLSEDFAIMLRQEIGWITK